MTEAAPHHLELINQLLVQRTHFRVHELVVNRQADSQDVNLWVGVHVSPDLWMHIYNIHCCFAVTSHLFLHQILQLRDLVGVVGVTDDVLLVKERLGTERSR